MSRTRAATRTAQGVPPSAADLRAHWQRLARTAVAARSAGPDWYRIERNAADEAEIYLYDVIGWDVTAGDFIDELRKLHVRTIHLHINSPGGFAWDGIAIYTALLDHPAEINVKVDGLAASAASIVAMAGDRVVMAKHAMLMIHRASGLVWGNADDMRKEAEILEKLDSSIAGVYADKAGGEVTDWLARMSEETWYTDREAVDAGLADEVAGDSDDQAQARAANFDLSIFAHPPAAFSRPPAIADPDAAVREAEAVAARAERDRASADVLVGELNLSLAKARG